MSWSHRFSESGTASPLRLLVIQPTSFCNIDCRYCYLAERHIAARMSPETFEKILERLLEAGLFGDELTILWHGGEPLAVSVEFYRQAHELCASLVPSSCAFHFNFQTNGTLITTEYCDFFAQTNCHVGVSIDGPQGITDAVRVYRNGNGVFEKVREGVGRLTSRGIPFSAICVLTSASLDEADAIFDFFANFGAKEVGFNIEEIEGANSTSTVFADLSAPVRYREFISRFYRRWRAEQPPFRLRDISQIERSLRHGTEAFSRLVHPFSIISVAHNGDWSTFAPELLYDQRFRFGNVMDGSFANSVDRAKFISASREIAEGVARCRAECDYFVVCGGGSPSNKIAENGTAASVATAHCLFSRRLPVDVVLGELELDYGLPSSVSENQVGTETASLMSSGSISCLKS